MQRWFTRGDSTDENACRCRASFEGETLAVAADDCPERGRLSESADCRATVVDALGRTAVDAVVTRSDGVERAYLDGAAALLAAAGRFATRVEPLDRRLADRARREPLAAATEAAGRAGQVADLAAKTRFALVAERTTADDALEPYVGPAVSDARIAASPPADATLRDRRTVETDAVVRRYATPASSLDCYHVRPREHEFDAATTAALASAVERLATAPLDEHETPYQAASAVADDGGMAAALGAVLRKHTQGLGVLEDLFADPRISDVFATAPVDETRLRVRVDGETMLTNIRLTAAGAGTLASTFRRTSGRAFSRASPTLDATATVADRQVRVAGVTEPVSDGLAFAFRAHDDARWRLSDLVANGTLPPRVAGVLSVAVEREAACLLAGPRGAGKTTTLGALLWELPQSVRTLVIEDTPELPVADLQSDGRDVQQLRTASGEGPSVDASEALRTALRLGEGALVVGEVRGEEASVLYEAMRVGDGDSAVLGTIHGSGGESVRERLVDAPDAYDSAAQKARVAARITYLDAVDARLAARARQSDSAGEHLDGRLRDRTNGSLRDLRKGLTARDTQRPRSRPVPTGPAGPVRTRVDARPQYLTLASVSESSHPAVEGHEHPLVARNVNVFTVPYGDAAGAVTDGVAGSADRARLATAATTLAAANATVDASPNTTLDGNRRRLRHRVERANDHVTAELAGTVSEETDADAAASRAIVDDALRRWETPAARGQALADGAAVTAVANVAADRQDLSLVEGDWLRLRL